MRLKDVLMRTIPVLGAVKPPHMQWVFATACGRFAEAISFFLANADEGVFKSITVSFLYWVV
jgi:hypothetical protein